MNMLPKLGAKRKPRIFDLSESPTENLAGKKFGNLEVIEWAGKSRHGCKSKCDFWFCSCDCSDSRYNPFWASTASLKSGNTRSCGCLNRKHLKSKSKIYNVWTLMNRRCCDTSDRAFKNYGGRGISVCDRWKDFNNFYADMGDPPEGMSLDRIDNDGNYCPENCRWATPKQQVRNQRTNRLITWRGETKTTADWGDDERLKKLGINSGYIRIRIDSGWSLEEAMTTPAVVGKQITYNGETMDMMSWSRRLGATANVVSKRIRAGWDIESAVTKPLRK